MKRERQRTTRRIWRAVLLVVISMGGLLSAAAPASAGGGCTPVTGWCSSTVNDSAFSATALFNWCRGGDSTGASTTSRPTCGTQRTYFLLSGDGHTPNNEDWDTFQVDAGWCYRVKFVVTGAPDFTRTYNRLGTSALYVKVENHVDAHIQAQSSASCP